MHPLLIGAALLTGLDLLKRAKISAPMPGTDAQLDASLMGGALLTTPRADVLPPSPGMTTDEVTIEDFLSALQSSPESVTTLSPEGHLRGRDICIGTAGLPTFVMGGR